MDAFEIRVHGIGDHDYYSALGRPEIEPRFGRSEVAKAPKPVGHPLKLVNWSRTSRGLSKGLLWYFAFPFTLVNTVGEMGRGERRLRFAVSTVGILLTISAAAWLIVFAETILKVVPLPGDDRLISQLISVLIPLGLAVTIIRRRPTEKIRSRWLNVVALAGFGVFVGIFQPAQFQYTGWLSRAGRFDAMTAVVLTTTVVTMLIAAVLITSRKGRAYMAAAALLLDIAMVAMHSVSSMLRMSLDWIATWLSPLPAGDAPTLQAEERSLMAYFDRAEIVSSRLDFVAVFSLVALIAFLIAAVSKLGLRFPRDKRERAEHLHNRVEKAPELLAGVLIVATILMAAGAALLVLSAEPLLTGGSRHWVIIFVNTLTAAMALLIILRHRLPAMRMVMGKSADIAGFWPVHGHPLAGGSYRQDALDAITRAVGTGHHVVLVGHSQGSIVCAWWTKLYPQGTIDLVTCGSPLKSLYATYFPGHFSNEFFTTVKTKSPQWTNFWRQTDPIATAVSSARNTELDDRPEVLGHSDYWTDPTQIKWVKERIAATLETNPASGGCMI
ncbi:hypothetical protein ACFQ05_25675 [Amycolatopsis umgeniensis]|uniref:Integral membrane protein n=1 Tax=Amycolatopsis umgeniensis TaxID=336628 RepID=A0A841B5J3_9PSEU|nr:hypothetical protein [Amycolatopsis umgeniensis]MBB5856269.1 hypothetical protein [Amycolatopsis umgeniensis]